MTRHLFCKCGSAASFASQTNETLDEEASKFRRDHNQAGCKLISEKEYRLAQSMDRKPKKKGKRK